jgi:hypothetical protein
MNVYSIIELWSSVGYRQHVTFYTIKTDRHDIIDMSWKLAVHTHDHHTMETGIPVSVTY